MRRLVYILALIFLAIGCKHNPNQVTKRSAEDDSLAVYFEKANLDSVPYAIRHSYVDKALAIVSKRPNDSMNRVNYFKVANRYWNMEALEDYKKIVELILKQSEKTNDSLALGKGFLYIGDYYLKVKKTEKAYLNYFKAEKNYRNINSKSKLIEALCRKIDLLMEQKDFINSEKNLYELLKLINNTSDNEIAFRVYNALGITYGELLEKDKALQCYLKCIQLCKENKSKSRIGNEETIQNNLGLLYQNLDNHKQAIIFFQRAFKKLSNFRDQSYAVLIDNLAYSKMKMIDFKGLPSLFYCSLNISDSLNKNASIIISKSNLAEFYNITGNRFKAIKFASDSYKLARETSSQHILLPLKQLSIADPKNAPKYAQEYIKISDSLQLAERKMRNKFARIEYETEELESQNKILKSQQQTIVYTSIALFCMLLVLVVFGYYVLKNRQLKLKREQQASVEKIYKLKIRQQQKVAQARQQEKQRISHELHDGVMGKLCGIRLSLFMLRKNRDQQTIAKSLKCVNELHNIEKEIRAIAYDLYGEIPDVNSIQR